MKFGICKGGRSNFTDRAVSEYLTIMRQDEGFQLVVLQPNIHPHIVRMSSAVLVRNDGSFQSVEALHAALTSHDYLAPDSLAVALCLALARSGHYS